MKKICFLIIIVTAAIAACKKKDDLLAPRLFRPVAAGALAADSNTIVASWQKIGGAKAYEVQVSRDTFQTVDRTVITDSSVAVITHLLFNQLYQVQVKAIAPDSSHNSKWATLGAVKTLSSILKTPALADISINSVRVRWTTKGAPVSSVKILRTSDSVVVKTIQLTSTDLLNELVIADGLEAGTVYTIMLYSGADLRGYVDFTTKAPFTGTVIDLSVISGRPTVLADTLPKAPSGSVILLNRNETYTISAGFAFSKSMVIMSAPDLVNTKKAKMLFTSNFSFATGSNIDELEFNDVHMYSDNYGSRYIFNNTASANIGKLKFINSRMEIFRGMVRLQSGTLNMGAFEIDNCIVDSIGNYAVFNIAASCKVDDISITNSTIYKVEGMIVSAAAANSVLVDNCTFSEAPLGNSKSYYIDFNSNAITNGVMVSNCLFGYGKFSSGATTVRDYRVGTTTVTTKNNYRTSDHTTAGNDFAGIVPYTRPAAQLWKDPSLGDFTIMDALFPGKNTTGDPRWR